MNLIAAVDRNWAIGNKGQLLVRIPGDHRMFRQETLDKVIVYGRKTLETFPMAQPLDRRINIVLSTNPSYKVKNAERVFTDRCSLSAIQLISQRSTMPMRRTPISPTWTKIRIGR